MESSSERSMLTEPLVGTSKGGFRTLPFIIANEALEKTASYGLLPNMILYLMGSYGMELATGANFIYFWSAATNLTPVIGAIVADSYMGRFWMIGCGSVVSILGVLLLWLTTVIPGARPCNESGSVCTSCNIFQLILLASSFSLMSIGAGGIRSSSLAFGADQLIKGDNLRSLGIIERFFNWYYVAASASVVVALTLLVYIQDNFGWRVGFGVPVVLMFLSALSFFLASPSYIKLKTRASSFLAFAHVLVASWKKRHLTLSSRTDQLYHHKEGSRLKIPSDRLRWLNKGCVILNAKEELGPDGTALDPWSLCTTVQVEELKALIKAIPMWSTGIMMSVTMSQPSFGTVQAGTMNRHVTSNFEIPAGSFGTFTIISIVLWVALYDRLVIPIASKLMGKPVHLSVQLRMGIGLLLSIFSMVVTAIVEGVRRKIAIEEGFEDDPKAVVHMSALWLLPHHCISGMAEAFVVVGQNELFYSEFPRSMASIATNLCGVGMSLANVIASLLMSSINSITSRGGKESWVSSNINKGHFDYYYWLLAGLSLLNFFYYLLCCRAHGSTEEQERVWDDDDEIAYE